MRNLFFQQALEKAARFFGRNERITVLLAQLIARLNRVNRNDINFNRVKEKANVLIRLVRSYSSGQYKSIPWKVVASILAAFLYFINPLDLIPDFTPVVGFTDDFSILIWVYTSVQDEIDKFLTWERSHIMTE